MEENKHNLPEENLPLPEELLPEETVKVTITEQPDGSRIVSC